MVTCPRCGSENAAGSNYCYNCGTNLRASGGDSPAPAVQGSDPYRPFATAPTEDTRARSETWGTPPGAPVMVPGQFPVEEPRRRRSRWVTVPLFLIAVLLVLCVAGIAFGFTSQGERAYGDFATWAVEEATNQAGNP